MIFIFRGKVIQKDKIFLNFKTLVCVFGIYLFGQARVSFGSEVSNTVASATGKKVLFSFANSGNYHINKTLFVHHNNSLSENERFCQFFRSSEKLICKGSIDFDFLTQIRNEKITDFIVEKYEAESKFRKKYWSENNLKTGVWYTRLPKIFQTLTGELQLKDTGFQVSIILRFLPNKDLKGYSIEGEAYSNKIVKISWRLKGALFLEFTKNQTFIEITIESVEQNGWKFLSNLAFFKRHLNNYMDEWKVFGMIKSHYVSESHYAFYKGDVWTRITKGECKFFGEVKLQNVNLIGLIAGNVSPPQAKQISIPQSAFSEMSIKNIIFKDSIFLNDFDKNSFKGVINVESIKFLNSKLEGMPRLDELFQNLNNLTEIYIEDCATPQLKFGSLTTLKNVKTFGFKGSGPFNIDDLSFVWLKNSNLTDLDLRNSHIKILVKGQSVFWSINSTLRNLDISYSTLTEEKVLNLVLKDLSIINFKGEGLNLKKIPTNALNHISKTLQYLSLKGNNFKKSLEKHMFDNIFHFPYMPNLEELNLMECHINYLEKGAFDNLPNLKILHISYNNLENLQDAWIDIKPKVTFLDLSHNGRTPKSPSTDIYELGYSLNLSSFENLRTLELSHSIFSNISKVITSLGRSLKNLFLKSAELKDLPENIFQNLINLERLDISSNRNIKVIQPFPFNLFKYLKSLQWLSLKDCRISSATVFNTVIFQSSHFSSFTLKNVKYLDLSANNIKSLDFEPLKMFSKLKTLNLSGNSITDWKISLFNISESLETLFLDENRIETINSNMFQDIKKLKKIKLGNNPFICGPYVYEILKIAGNNFQQNEMKLLNNIFKKSYNYSFFKESYHNLKIKNKFNMADYNNVNILDWSDNDYICFSKSLGKFTPFASLNETFGDLFEKNSDIKQVTILWLPAVTVTGIVVTVAIICWKWLDVHLITRAVRNAVALSFIGHGEKGPVKFEYNIFVSYSDKDRSWVVENLLPHLESWGDLKVCLHERDFKVGLSILENIIGCIDSSRNIILVLSQAFLKSQWCQYEMHLAQHRLLEKGRDQLLLIFLEYIPSVKRPKTLKYLMMTKTYLEWPGNGGNEKNVEIFWSRLKKSLQGVFG